MTQTRHITSTEPPASQPRRQRIASLAHGLAHETIALREALGRLAGLREIEDVRRLLRSMIEERSQELTALALESTEGLPPLNAAELQARVDGALTSALAGTMRGAVAGNGWKEPRR